MRSHAPSKPADFDQFGRRNVRLRLQQDASRRGARSRPPRTACRLPAPGKLKPCEPSNGSPDSDFEPVVPHQPREERGVDHRRRATLVARAGAMRTDDVVALDADGHRLRVAHAVASVNDSRRRCCRGQANEGCRTRGGGRARRASDRAAVRGSSCSRFLKVRSMSPVNPACASLCRNSRSKPAVLTRGNNGGRDTRQRGAL